MIAIPGVRVDKGLEGDELADDHPEGGNEHPGHADHHHRSEFRQAHDQIIHILYVTASQLVFNDPDAEKEEGLRHCVKDDEQQGRPDRRIRVDSRAGHDQAEVGYG